MEKNHQRIVELLEMLYGSASAEAYAGLKDVMEFWQSKPGRRNTVKWVDNGDVMLITYGDSIKAKGEYPLVTLDKFLSTYAKGVVTGVHILPMFPYTSDDGFSVVDYGVINSELGDWEDIKKLSESFDLMFDAVVNHVSKSSRWFDGYLNCEEKYKDYFITSDPDCDYSNVTRPRTLPLLTPFKTAEGEKYVWTTFSEDQIDLNYSNPGVLLEVLNVLLTYACKGARFIRLDAVGFLWKELDTSCMHLKQTHAIVKLMRLVLDEVFPGTILITETNVPHIDNISYFGDGADEAHMVYQFPLPPLVLFSFLAGNTSKLSRWAQSLEETPLSEGTTYFNFLASHDGIGVRPAEGILTSTEIELLLNTVIKHGGFISYKTDSNGKKSPYELNIGYMDALTDPSSPDEKERADRFIAAQAILLSMAGVPGIYIHSMVGSRNWYDGVVQSGINRRINREKLVYMDLCREMEKQGSFRNRVFSRFSDLIRLRRGETAFCPDASQKVLFVDNRAFMAVRHNQNTGKSMLVAINVTGQEFYLQNVTEGIDIISREEIKGEVVMMRPYQVRWIRLYSKKL